MASENDGRVVIASSSSESGPVAMASTSSESGPIAETSNSTTAMPETTAATEEQSPSTSSRPAAPAASADPSHSVAPTRAPPPPPTISYPQYPQRSSSAPRCIRHRRSNAVINAVINTMKPSSGPKKTVRFADEVREIEYDCSCF